MCFQLQEYLTPGVVLKFRPYRNVFIGISSVAIFFAVLIIVENIIFLSIVSKQSIPLLLVPYILSWVLFFLGFCFARFAYLIHHGRKNCSSVIPFTSPIAWEDSRPVSPIVPVSDKRSIVYFGLNESMKAREITKTKKKTP
ncbi:hypothetical protein CAEBREN_01387 [Caenorhabditis brenneri]|uniref:Uncharacterized protein n=1 Tax=Caenorhabditis brenneri TaxID=135651 RepID=G0MJW9_CAEBE|nr:hypothetical protein CAEBREN_01387 [Caenorhabditis brenneri]